MKKIIDTKILQQTIDKWGAENQTEMIIEECSELILALQKMKRSKKQNSEKILMDVCDEIADVIIMTKTAELLFDKELIEERVEFKMNRIKNKLDGKGYL